MQSPAVRRLETAATPAQSPAGDWRQPTKVGLASVAATSVARGGLLDRRSSALGWIGAFALLLALVGSAGTASAEGLVIRAGPIGEAGPQIDAALVSPAARAPAPLVGQPRTYIVQRGDTLSAIAARLGVSVAALLAQNGLTDPDRIVAGTVLQVGFVADPMPALAAEGPVTRVQLWPWPPTQGQTLVIWLHTRSAVSVTAQFGGAALPIVGDGRRHWALVPIDALAPPAVRPLTVTVGAATFTLPVAIRAGAFETQEIPASASDPILSQAEKVNAEYAQMAALFARRSAGEWTPRSRFITPLAAGVAYEFSSPFGSRRTYGSAAGLTAHAGEDYAVPAGTPVLAPAAGVVVLAEPLFVRGNAVVLDHGQGVLTGYWHLESLNVTAGERVAQGQVLGAVGSTGLSTGPHLHWELRVAGVAVHPLQWVEQR